MQSVWEHGRKLEISAFQWFPSLLGRKKKSEAAPASANPDVFRKLRPPPYFKNNGTIAELAENQKPQSAGSNPRAGWKFLAELLSWSNGCLSEWRFPMSFKSVFFGLAVLVSVSSVSMAQSMPNYGPNPPPNTDSFGQVPSGAKPPGVSRYGHRAYAYVPNQHRHHYRHWHHRHWYR